MWIVHFNMGEETHLVGTLDTEVESKAFVEGYAAAIANHTADISKEERKNLVSQFDVKRVDDPKEE